MPVLFLLTGCVEVTTDHDNRCYRYVDYKMEEHYMDYDDNVCGVRSGIRYCHDDKKYVTVFEYELVTCPTEVSNE